MSMSLDGFIAGPNVRFDNGLGDGGERLHEWVFPAGPPSDSGPKDSVAPTGVNGQVLSEVMSTGAVVAGPGTGAPAGGGAGGPPPGGGGPSSTPRGAGG